MSGVNTGEERSDMSGDAVRWRCHTTVSKYVGDDTSGAPYEVVEIPGNLLLFGGASALWERLKGTAVTAFDSTNAYLGVGDSSAAEAAAQTDLQAATNKLRKAMDATYPTHTDGTGASGNAQIVYQATFATTDANYAWNEWGLFNASAAGRMLNRRAGAGLLGTKTSASSWVLTVTLTLA